MLFIKNVQQEKEKKNRAKCFFDGASGDFASAFE